MNVPCKRCVHEVMGQCLHKFRDGYHDRQIQVHLEGIVAYEHVYRFYCHGKAFQSPVEKSSPGEGM